MGDVTQVLGEAGARPSLETDQLFPLVYQELRRLAAERFARESPGITLQPTALVHEVYFRLAGAADRPHWESRGHFFAAAARAMRQILVDAARRRGAVRRGGGHRRHDVDLNLIAGSQSAVDLLELDEALTALAEQHPRKAQLVELRFFSGLTMPQAAATLVISEATAHREWAYARAWLLCRLSGGPA